MRGVTVHSWAHPWRIQRAFVGAYMGAFMGWTAPVEGTVEAHEHTE